MSFQTNLLRVISFALVTLVAATYSQAEAVRFNTNLGSFEVDLYEDLTPQTVANFLFYLDSGAYTNSIVHRSSPPNNVIQGGGFTNNPGGVPIPIPTVAPVPGEPGISNLRGTIGMARLADPDSATSQWFINTDDNPVFDTLNGGFTVFGNVTSGMDVVDLIAALTIVDAGAPFGELPILDPALLPSLENNLVVVNSIVSIPEPTGLSLLLVSGALLVCQRRRI